MEHIEFIRKTDHQHMRTYIKSRIQDVFQERDYDLDRRREQLRSLLTFEELQQEEELANLFRERVLENTRKRLEWAATAKFEKAEAEKEFLKLKQIQRELLNCEEMRPVESRKITEETKKVQLMQIAEKKQRQMKEKEIDKIWHEASLCLEKEREKQEQYENHLRKIIVVETVGVLNQQLEHLKYVKDAENEEKKEEHIQNVRAWNEDIIMKDKEERRRLEEKIKEGNRQRAELKAAEAERRTQIERLKFYEEKINELHDIQRQQEEERLKIANDNYKESYNQYLEHVKDSKRDFNLREKMLDTALDTYNLKNQPQPINKKPYRSTVR